MTKKFWNVNIEQLSDSECMDLSTLDEFGRPADNVRLHDGTPCNNDCPAFHACHAPLSREAPPADCDDAIASALAARDATIAGLRSEVADLRALGVSLHKSAAMGRDAERAAVVAWLREVADAPETYIDEGIALRDASAAIERGLHRREGDE